MKFQSENDLHLFLVEIGDAGLIESASFDDFQPSTEQMERFFNGRKSLIPKLKEFRKSQNAKSSWRKNRYKMMRGIKSFHKSTEGKRFHRALGRHLATRMATRYRGAASKAYEKYESLKSISSIRTHAYIKKEYFRTVDEEVEYELFFDEFVPATLREEARLFDGSEKIDEEDMDIMLRSIDPIFYLTELAIINEESSPDRLVSDFNQLVDLGTFSYTEILRKIGM